MKKIIVASMMMLSTATAIGDPLPTVEPPAYTNNQIGLAMEERPDYLTTFAFYNHLINQRIFYEIRAYYTHNYIVRIPLDPLPPITQQQNLDGTGGVGILGYHFQLNQNILWMPFIRLQYLTNTVAAYQDTAGNEIASDTFSTYLGVRLSVKISEQFFVFTQYFGGYQTTNLYGKGFFATRGAPRVYAWSSTLEFGFPYRMTPAWQFTPFIQWITTDNNPNGVAFAAPMRQSGMTTTANVFGAKLGYAFA